MYYFCTGLLFWQIKTKGKRTCLIVLKFIVRALKYYLRVNVTLYRRPGFD